MSGDPLSEAFRSDDPDLVAAAVEALGRFVASIGPDHPAYRKHLANLGALMYRYFELTGNRDVLTESLKIQRFLVEDTHTDPPARGINLGNLGRSLTVLGEDSRDPMVLGEAVAVLREATSQPFPPERPDLAVAARSNLAAALVARYVVVRDVANLREAAENGRRVMAATADDHPNLDGRLDVLANALRHWVEADGNEVLPEAITVHRRLRALLPAGRERLRAASNLATLLARRARLDNDDSLEAEAVAFAREAYDQTPAGDPMRPLRQANLGALLAMIGERTPDRGTLQAAVDLLREASGGLPAGSDPHRVGQVLLDRCRAALNGAVAPAAPASAAGTVLAEVLRLVTRFDEDRDPRSLDEAITLLRAAIPEAEPGTPEEVELRAGLASALFRQNAFAKREPAAAELGGLLTGVLRRTPVTHPGYLRRLSMLGVVLVPWLGFADAGEDRRAAVVVFRDATSELPVEHLIQMAVLGFLDKAYLRAFDATADDLLLDEAIRVGRALVSVTDPDDPVFAVHLSNLANSTSRLAEMTGDARSLGESADLYDRAIAALPPDAPDRPGMLMSLLGVLAQQLPGGGSPDRLDAALAELTRIVGDTPADHPQLRYWLVNLAAVRSERAALSREVSDLDPVIDLHRRIETQIPVDDPAYWYNLQNLAVAYADKSALTGDRAVLDEAADAARRAVDIAGPNHPMRATSLNNLGRVLGEIARIDGTDEPIAASVGVFREAATIESAPARVRGVAAAGWGYGMRLLGDLPDALDGLALAVGLLGEVAWRGLQRADQERMLTDFDSLAADAAAVAVELGRYEHAVELLEQGRGVLQAQALESRSEYDRLRAAAPGLAAGLAEVQDELDATVNSAATDPSKDRRAALLRRRADLLAEIRELDGFGDFLGAPAFGTLAAAAQDGPVVIINVSEFRCDALAVTAGGVRHMPLATVSRQDVWEAAARFVTAVRTGRYAAPVVAEDVRTTLDWLDEHITGPILDALPLETVRPLPRVWWCPIGALAFLPLHAAGSTMDRVISSYTPTLRALLYARRPSTQSASSAPRRLIVALSTTPGLPDLPAASAERREFIARFPSATEVTGPAATIDAVVDQLPRHSWVHFACHAAQDAGDTAGSGLFLHDGPLTVGRIGRLRIMDGEFAFLSACQTSQAGTTLTDESLTLASAMLLAGYRRVIGTLWSINDSLAPRVARSVYDALADGSPADAATALHTAVRSLRRANPAAPLRWASYVHIGP